MASISNTSSVPGLVKEPSQHAGAQSLLAATIGLMSLSAPTNPRNSSSEVRDAMAMDRFSVRERIAAMNRDAAAVSPPDHPSFSFHACEETEAPPPTPVSLPRLPARDSIEPVISTKNFPETLLEVLSSGRYPDIISWLPHGRGFVILDKERFARAILPRYFDGAKFPSFTRRMKRWGFVRVPRGPEMGAYYHESFARGRPELVREMRYGAGGKFREGKKKKQEDEKLKKEKKKQEREKAAENERVQQYLSNSVLNNDLPEDKYFRPQIQSATPKMDTWHSVNPQEHHMSLPAALSQNKAPMPGAVQKKMAIDAMGHHAKNARVAATIRKNMEWLDNQAASVRSSSFPTPMPPRSEIPLDLHSRGIAEIERELLLARSALSRQAAHHVSSSGPIRAVGARSTTRGRLSNHQPYRASEIIHTQRMAELVTGHCTRQSHAPTLSNNCSQSRKSTGSDNRMRNTTPEIQASSKIQRDAMDAVIAPEIDLQLIEAIARSVVESSSSTNTRGRSGPVVMSRKEEAELLARYLALRRIV